jgi:putative ubiquitin-RnfH superfamily antitoxin RatB of RatAB toxin-antitoxin module
MHVTVIYSPAARKVREWQVALAQGATVLQALRASGLAPSFPDLDLMSLVIGVWGRQAALGQLLREGDRVEIYRPLEVDPKLARRERFRRQGSRAAGLFAKKNAGTKAGD